MESQGQDQPHYIFHVRPPAYSRVIGIALLAFNLVPSLCIGVKIGFGWVSSDFLAVFIYMAVLAGTILFALWLIFPPQSTRARFEFSHDRIRFIPNLIARMIGEKTEEIAISSQSAEILICQRILPQTPKSYRIIVRATDGDERELASHSPHTRVVLNIADIESMDEAIPPATGLPVRVITQRKSLPGAIEELPWTPSFTKANPLRTVSLTTVTFPFVGGILMGCLTMNPTIVIAFGLALWFCMVLAIYLGSKTDPNPKKFPLVYALTTLVTFGAAYVMCFFVTAHLCGRI